MMHAMNVPLRQPMTLAAFLAWEERQELRYEYDGIQPLAMTGGTASHDRIMRRLHRVLDARLSGTSCEPFGPNMKVIADGKVRYPDALVTCRPVSPGATVVEHPLVVFEIISKGSVREDRVIKLRDYQRTPSIQRYIILEQDSVVATVFTRDDAHWVASAFVEGDTLPLPEIGIELPLAELYAGIPLAAAEDVATLPPG